jgi:formylglycine-generating enzyme required for sulfatase activity
MLSKKTGMNFRLPTEAEWEFAARSARSEGRMEIFPNLTVQQYNDKGYHAVNAVGWTAHNSRNAVHPVGEKAHNSKELFDICGNVAEFVADFYGKDYYAISPKKNPKGPATGDCHTIRGGSIIDLGEWSMTISRYCEKGKTPFVGFRLVLSGYRFAIVLYRYTCSGIQGEREGCLC